MFVLGAQKNCLGETVLLSTYNLCFGWNSIYQNRFFLCHPPATKGLFGHGEGCTLFGTDLVGVDHIWNWPRGARHFLYAYHMNQVSGLGPHLHEHK